MAQSEIERQREEEPRSHDRARAHIIGGILQTEENKMPLNQIRTDVTCSSTSALGLVRGCPPRIINTIYSVCVCVCGVFRVYTMYDCIYSGEHVFAYMLALIVRNSK